MKRQLILSTLVALSLLGCAGKQAPVENATAPQAIEFRYTTVLDPSNPFAQPSTLPYGLEDFSKIKPEHFKPALEAGMAQQIEEIAQIVDQEAAPTFENTIIPLEKSGSLFMRAARPFFNIAESDNDDVIQQTQTELAEKLAAHEDAIMLNDKLFKRIEAIYNDRANLNLDAESLRLVEQYYLDFVRSGASLQGDQKAELSKINAELATLQTAYGQNLLGEVNDSAVVVDTLAELDGLPEDQVNQAAAEAKKRGLDGKYVIVLTNTTIQPVLKSLNNRDLRARIHAASLARGTRGNAYDNRNNVLRLIELRARRAQLLGYKTFADYAVADQMAMNIPNVNAMLASIVGPAKAKAAEEAAELQALIDAQKGGFKLEAYDWLYYSEQLRKAKYDFDDNQLKPYFELNNVLENGVFYAAQRLYGVKFVERKDLKGYNPDARVFEVFDENGTVLGLFVGDYYARSTKSGGAWMTEQQLQNKLMNQLPIIENQINIAKPADGEPTLLTFEEVTTLFHEFGHALHGLFSNVTYPKFSGTSVPRDFVEFPSQFNETWAWNSEVLANFAVHYQTGEKLPQALMDKLIAASKFNQGYATTEYLGATILDQMFHQLTYEEIQALDKSDYDALEKAMLEKGDIWVDVVPPRYRSTFFHHVFANSYSASYYAYIWAEVLDADAEQWFKEHGMTRENGDAYRTKVLQKGFSDEPMKMYKDLTGREPSSDALLIRRGLK